jgi:hypothetical protein
MKLVTECFDTTLAVVLKVNATSKFDICQVPQAWKCVSSHSQARLSAETVTGYTLTLNLMPHFASGSPG